MSIEKAVECAVRKLEWQKEQGFIKDYTELEVRRAAEEYYRLHNGYNGSEYGE